VALSLLRASGARFDCSRITLGRLGPRALALSLSLALGVALGAGCGYQFAAGVGRFPAGVERVYVRPLENLTADADVGALVAIALRQELARRSMVGGEQASARIEGEVLSSGFTPSSGGAATYTQSISVRIRLMVGEKKIAERGVTASQDYLAGVDPLESEGRRRVAIRALSESIARDAIEQLELP
jgi:hypothetical protein